MKIKILFILHFPPPIHGAAMVGQYIKDSILINQEVNSHFINLSTSASVNDIGKSGIKKWIRYLGILNKTLYQGIFHRPDLVYITMSSHGLGLIKDSFIVLICRLFRLSYVFHFHNKGVKKYSQTSIGKKIYPFVFKKARVILLSPLLYPDIAEYVPESRVYYCANGIPNLGVDNKIHDSAIQEPLQLLFLSNLIKSKGILDLLEACKILKVEGIAFQCTIAGGEGDITEIELRDSIHKLALNDQVQYLGKVSGEVKNEIFEKSDLFIHPTHDDCFPLVLLEAMQAGLPIIATKEGAIPEIVEDGVTGLLVPAQRPQVLAEKIKFLIAHPDKMIRMGKAGRDKFYQEFTLVKFEERFLQVVNQVAAVNL